MGFLGNLFTGAKLGVAKAVGAVAIAATVVGAGAVGVYKYTTQTIDKNIVSREANGSLILVNGTDKDWKIASKHSYQMSKWDNSFPETIKSGEVKTVDIGFGQGVTEKTTNNGGEVKYQIVGTDQTFEIQARVKGNEAQARTGVSFSLQAVFTNISFNKVPKGTTIPLGWSDNGSRYFILAGKEGNYTGNGLDTENWMRNNKNLIGDRRLMEICIPGSHDSGMSRSTYTNASAEETVLTHTKNIADQLKLGVRFFDIRPGTRDGVYYTAHIQSQNLGITDFVGATGQPIDEVIKEVNDFTNKHEELVILNVSHAMNIDWFKLTVQDFDQPRWNKFLDYLNKNVKNLVSAPPNADLSRMKLNELLKDNQKVIILVADDKIELSPELHGKGFFTTIDNFAIYDKYADKKNWDEMAKDQYEKLNKQGFQYFLLSWTLTQQWSGIDNAFNLVGTNDSILKLAQEANWRLSEIYSRVGSNTFPNIIYTDDIHNDQQAALALAINWKRTIFPNYSIKPLAVVYEGADFSNASDEFNELEKILTINNKVGNDKATSIKVASGYKVTLYENNLGTGKELVIDGDREYDVKDIKGWANLSKLDFAGIASNLKIERKPRPPVVVYKERDFSAETEYDEFYELNKLFPVNNYVKNDEASSIRVASGYKVTLFENSEGTGKELVIDGDTEYDVKGFNGWANLSLLNFAGTVSNLKIEKK